MLHQVHQQQPRTATAPSELNTEQQARNALQIYRERPHAARALRQIAARAATLALRNLERVADKARPAQAALLQQYTTRAEALLVQTETHPLWCGAAPPPTRSSKSSRSSTPSLPSLPSTPLPSSVSSTPSSTPTTSTTFDDDWDDDDDDDEGHDQYHYDNTDVFSVQAALAGASSQVAYKAALSRLPSQVTFCIVPLAKTTPEHPPSTEQQRQRQDAKDLQRDRIDLNGTVYDGAEETYEGIVRLVCQVCQEERQRQGQLAAAATGNDAATVEQDMVSNCTRVSLVPSAEDAVLVQHFARALLRTANRTNSGGDALDAMYQVLRHEEYAMTVPVSGGGTTTPLSITVSVGPWRGNSTWYYGVRAVVAASIVHRIVDPDDPTVAWSTVEGKTFTLEVSTDAGGIYYFYCMYYRCVRYT